jgi:hypothetical protein
MSGLAKAVADDGTKLIDTVSADGTTDECPSGFGSAEEASLFYANRMLNGNREEESEKRFGNVKWPQFESCVFVAAISYVQEGFENYIDNYRVRIALAASLLYSPTKEFPIARSRLQITRVEWDALWGLVCSAAPSRMAEKRAAA